MSLLIKSLRYSVGINFIRVLKRNYTSIYLPHLPVLPAAFGLQCLLPPYLYFRALYAVPVRQARGLLIASFRFRLTADTLAVQLCASLLPTYTRDLHPLENSHAGQTKSLQT